VTHFVGRWSLLVPIIAFLVVLPLVSSAYLASFFIVVFLYVALAGSWNLFSGTTGYVSLGHGLFFGIGAYGFAVSMAIFGLDPVLAMLVAGGVAALGALLLGLVLLTTRIRVAYFAIVMLGFNEVAKTIVANTKSLGSSYGLTIPPLPSAVIAYYFLLALAAVVTVLAHLVLRSHWGIALKAIVADEVAAEATGVRTVALKLVMFVMSGTLVGLAGAVIAWNWSYIDPYMAFDLVVSFEMVVMTMFGGIGTVWGPVLGAVAMAVLREVLATSLPHFHAIIFGVLVIALILWAPGGIVELAQSLRRRLRKPRSVNEATP